MAIYHVVICLLFKWGYLGPLSALVHFAMLHPAMSTASQVQNLQDYSPLSIMCSTIYFSKYVSLYVHARQLFCYTYQFVVIKSLLPNTSSINLNCAGATVGKILLDSMSLIDGFTDRWWRMLITCTFRWWQAPCHMVHVFVLNQSIVKWCVW